MSILGLFTFNKPQTSLGGIVLDILESESYSLPGKVTRYAVEDGSQISDHIFIEARELTISGIISHAEFVTFGALDGGFSKSTRLSEILTEIETLRDAREIFQVVTGLRKYTDMAFESLEFSRKNGDMGGNWLYINAKMIGVTKVSLQTAEVPAAPSARNRAGQTATPAGRNTPSGAGGSGEQQGPTRPQSLLQGARSYVSGQGGLGNLFGLRP